MKPELMEITTQDRQATGEEVRSAISVTNERSLQLCRTQGNYCLTDSDFGGIIRYPAEELEFLSFLSDTDESVTN